MNVNGTHMGHLDAEARERRRSKNLRSRSRVHPKGFHHGFDMPVGGAAWRAQSRLLTVGNRAARGLV